MNVRIYAYPTNNGRRVSLHEAVLMNDTEDGWSEQTPEPGTRTTDLELVAQALRWASDGQAVRIEIN